MTCGNINRLLLEIKQIKTACLLINLDIAAYEIKLVTGITDSLKNSGKIIVSLLRHLGRTLKMLLVYNIRLFAGLDTFGDPTQDTRLELYKQNISHPGAGL